MTKLANPKKTFIDIETSPNIGTFWRPGYKVQISADNIIQERVILCAAWRHSDEDKTHYTDKLVFNNGVPCDKQIVKDICNGLENTEILIHHNGDRFDLPWINGRALFHRIPRVQPVRTVDTLTVVRKTFNLNSYRLDYIGNYLGLGRKIKTTFSLWQDAMNGDKDALDEMVSYNIRDVELLMDVYNAIEPYNDSRIIDNTVSEDSMICTFCGSDHLQSRGRYLNLKTYRKRYQCMGCGKFLKSELIRK